MLKTSRFVALAILGVIAASPANAASKPVATVNGSPIPQERMDLRVKMVTSQGTPDSPDLRKAIREDLVNIELMAQEAHKQGLDKQADTVQQLELQKQSVLVSALVQGYMKTHQVTEQAIGKEYDNLKAAAVGKIEYRIRHILVEKESDAKSIAEKLKKGGNFEAFAKADSKDGESKELGGDLGWFPVDSISNAFVKPFGDAVMKLQKGQLSEPVQSQFGWHIIKLEDVRDEQVPPLNDIKPQIAQHLHQQLVKGLIVELRGKAKIE